MAELAQGAGPDNPRRLTLATYVLLRRFEEVVDVANERLAVMSDGRPSSANDGPSSFGGVAASVPPATDLLEGGICEGRPLRGRPSSFVGVA